MDGNQWIMVDFLKPRELNGILTQGSPNLEQWVTKFKVSYSTDGFHFTPYQEGGQTKLFEGNSDRLNVKKNIFSYPVHARYIKIFPVEWAPAGIAMRMNVLGCYGVSPAVTPTVTPSVQPTASPTAHPAGHTDGKPTEHPPGVSGMTPSIHPSSQSGAVPSVTPYGSPTGHPTVAPPRMPTFEPSEIFLFFL